ncbi:MAG TPA: prepilin peptidase [Verrucomicrobiae bacterium]|nr:prepilin peptidase [Verrucomicrobiae bacterium]
MTWLRLYVDFIVFVFGAVVGSFLNVCVHRMPRNESVVSPPSHCPHCSQRIRWTDNIPLVSYVALRGKCRHCGGRISPRYFLVELLTAVVFLLVWNQFKDSQPWLCPIYWLLVGGLIAGSFIDFEHYIIPNELTMGGVVVGFLSSVALPSLQHAPSRGLAALRSVGGIMAGGLVLFAIAELGKLLFGRLRVLLPQDTVVVIANGKLKLPDEEIAWADLFSRRSDRIRFDATKLKFADKQFDAATVVVEEDLITVNGESRSLADAGPIEATTDRIVIPREAMGLGDVKLLAAIGAFLGWQSTVFAIVVSSTVGSLVSLALIAVGKKGFQSRIPYGPYIALAAVIWIFAQGQLLAMFAAYLGDVKDFLTIMLGRG